MYCPSCGAALQEAADRCPHCGRSVAGLVKGEETSTPRGGGSAGFSKRISDPAFANYRTHSGSWSAVFSLIFAAMAVAGFALAGSHPGSRMQNPQALYVGLAIGAMFVTIALAQIKGSKHSRSWDGTVVDKRMELRQTPGDGQGAGEPSCVCTVVIRKDNGRMHAMRFINDGARYDYFSSGDRVRYHAGLGTYEKYDKSQDSIIFCNVCGAQQPIELDYCSRCRYPLLK